MRGLRPAAVSKPAVALGRQLVAYQLVDLSSLPDFAPENGFYHGASVRLGEMLRGADVSTPAPTPASDSRAPAI